MTLESLLRRPGPVGLILSAPGAAVLGLRNAASGRAWIFWVTVVVGFLSRMKLLSVEPDCLSVILVDRFAGSFLVSPVSLRRTETDRLLRSGAATR